MDEDEATLRPPILFALLEPDEGYAELTFTPEMMQQVIMHVRRQQDTIAGLWNQVTFQAFEIVDLQRQMKALRDSIDG